MTYAPVARDECGRTLYLSQHRQRRLLRMAATAGFNHKAFYSQYCWLQGYGYTGWVIGTAYLTPLGAERLRELDRLFA